MKTEREGVPREDVIRFYATYDRRKKGQPPLEDLDTWPWRDPDGLDRKLLGYGLKEGVIAAYRTWTLAQLHLPDLLDCAVYDGIFPGESQALGRLVLRGKLAEWVPLGAPEWWRSIGNGVDLDSDSALILRPSVRSEAPAKWYIEDGSGRALALVQRILRHGQTSRSAWAYVGDTPDQGSSFIKSRPELRTSVRRPAPW